MRQNSRDAVPSAERERTVRANTDRSISTADGVCQPVRRTIESLVNSVAAKSVKSMARPTGGRLLLKTAPWPWPRCRMVSMCHGVINAFCAPA